LLAIRSVVQTKEAKVEKLRRAVIEASKQCGRNALMRIHPPISLEKWCGLSFLPATKWVAHPEGSPLKANVAGASGIAVAIGPEGGLTAEELDVAVRHGFQTVRMGPRILRVETAAMAIAALIGLALE
jgi:16S rRNA (uracil1498-N3)-methyltransferase